MNEWGVHNCLFLILQDFFNYIKNRNIFIKLKIYEYVGSRIASPPNNFFGRPGAGGCGSAYPFRRPSAPIRTAGKIKSLWQSRSAKGMFFLGCDLSFRLYQPAPGW